MRPEPPIFPMVGNLPYVHPAFITVYHLLYHQKDTELFARILPFGGRYSFLVCRIGGFKI